MIGECVAVGLSQRSELDSRRRAARPHPAPAPGGRRREHRGRARAWPIGSSARAGGCSPRTSRRSRRCRATTITRRPPICLPRRPASVSSRRSGTRSSRSPSRPRCCSVIDDSPVGRRAPLRFLASLGDEVFASRLLVLAAYRSEEANEALQAVVGAPHVRELALARLDEEDIATLVGHMLAMASPPAPFVRFLEPPLGGQRLLRGRVSPRRGRGGAPPPARRGVEPVGRPRRRHGLRGPPAPAVPARSGARPPRRALRAGARARRARLGDRPRARRRPARYGVGGRAGPARCARSSASCAPGRCSSRSRTGATASPTTRCARSPTPPWTRRAAGSCTSPPAGRSRPAARADEVHTGALRRDRLPLPARRRDRARHRLPGEGRRARARQARAPGGHAPLRGGDRARAPARHARPRAAPGRRGTCRSRRRSTASAGR